jgi:site-specific DNA-methyltransferase (adenine-specific)
MNKLVGYPELRLERPDRATTLSLDPGEVLRDVGQTPPYWTGQGGVLFAGDCLDYLPAVRDQVIDTVFADPPSTLANYMEGNRKTTCLKKSILPGVKVWLQECVRVLKPGGALFTYNLPRWNIPIGAYLMEQGLLSRHWIAVEMKSCLPIEERLDPAHYGLLYFTNGKPKTFRKIRTPILTCRHCGGEIRDYGGHRHAMNPNGVNLMNVWDDIPPVRHGKFKSDKRPSNALSTKVLDRVIEMTTVPGDVVLDPFGGYGTTYAVARDRGRRWLGIDIDFADVIVERLVTDVVTPHANMDYVEAKGDGVAGRYKGLRRSRGSHKAKGAQLGLR